MRKPLRTLYRAVSAIYRNISPTERKFTNIYPAINSIEGLLVSPDQERWLFKAARSLPDKAIIVEIGSFKGRSTCCLAYGCEGTGKKVYAIDTFDGNETDFYRRDFFDEFRNNIEKTRLADYVIPIKGLSANVLKTWDKPIHLLFIDGSHKYEDVLEDFSGFFPHVVFGGIVAMHDVVETWPGPLKVWREYAEFRLVKTGYCKTIAFGRKPAKPEIQNNH